MKKSLGETPKQKHLVDVSTSEKRCLVEALHTDDSVREICETLGFNRGLLLYYEPKRDVCEAELREEIVRLSLRYPTYGYRRITAVLLRQGYTVGHRRVARLMKSENLSVGIKRRHQTTTSLDGAGPWMNRVRSLDICRPDQVWVGDITYVRLKRRFVYVAVLMDVFTRVIRGWQLRSNLSHSLTLSALEAALEQSVPEIHHSDQGVQYLSSAYVSTLLRHGNLEISVAHRGCPWENG